MSAPTDGPTPTSAAVRSPTPTPTPTLDPAEVQKQAAVDAATATVTRFLDVSDEIAEGGYAEVGELNTLMGGDLRPRILSLNERLRAAGARQTSRGTIESIELAGYEPGLPDAGRERVLLEACVDNTEREVLLPDGTSDIDPASPDRAVVTYTVQHQVDFWTVDDAQADFTRTC